MTISDKLQKTYNNIYSILVRNNIEVSDFKPISYGIQFKVTIHNWSGVIRVFQNKKGELRNDFSQLKNDEYSQQITSLIESDKSFAKSIVLSEKDEAYGFPLIGTDESGKGDYFGPLVSAGVYVDEKSAKVLMASGIRDSKNLTDNKNIALAKKIFDICKGRISIIEISPEKYNNLYDQFIKEKKNLNTLLAWGHAKAIEELLTKIDCYTAIADQFADEGFIHNKLQERGKKINLIQMHKAEQNIAVAAASILARARFLEKLSKLSNDFNIELPKGASRKVIENAKKIVETYGKDGLRKVAKLHFKTTKQVIFS